MSTRTEIEEEFGSYQLTLCFAIEDLIGENWKQLTLQELYDSPPSENKLISRCGVRGKSAFVTK